MKSRISLVVLALLVLIALPQDLSAQHSHYKLIDLGTFGGPASYFSDPGNGAGFLVLNNERVVVGRASTSTPDPTCWDADCYLAHAFR